MKTRYGKEALKRLYKISPQLGRSHGCITVPWPKARRQPHDTIYLCYQPNYFSEKYEYWKVPLIAIENLQHHESADIWGRAIPIIRLVYRLNKPKSEKVAYGMSKKN